MTHSLGRTAFVLLLLPLATSRGEAQFKEPPRAEKVDVQVRFRIRADRDERVRQYRALEKHLAALGFVDARKDDPDRDLDELDPNAERHVGTIPGAKVLDVLNEPRVQNILFAPAGHTYPDALDKPVAVRIGLRTGLHPNLQQELHNQTVKHLARLGFVPALGYDPRGYTIVRGSIPYKNLDLLVKDIRLEPSGWFLPNSSVEKLDSPLRDRNPLRWAEVLPVAEAPPPFAPAPVLPIQQRYSADLRAVLLDPARKDAPIRVEVVFQNRLEDLESLRTLIQGRYAGSALEGAIGNVASIRLPRASFVEFFASEPGVLGVRLPRQGSETIALVPGGKALSLPEALKSARLDELHKLGYTGAGMKVVLIGSDFTGADKLIGTELPKRTTIVDLTAELTADMLPMPPDPARQGTGTAAARALAAVAPDAELVLVRIDPGCFFHLYEVVKLTRSDVPYTDSLLVRLSELTVRSATLEGDRTRAVDDYKKAFTAPVGNAIAIAERKKAETELNEFLEKEKDPKARKKALDDYRQFSALSDTDLAVRKAKADLDAVFEREKQHAVLVNRFTAFQKQLTALNRARAIVNTLVWESGYPLDALNEFAGTLDRLAMPVPPRAVKPTTPPPAPLVWVQAGSNAGAAVWGGPFVDANRDGLLEFVPLGSKLPQDNWSPQLNFLGTRAVTGEVGPEIAKDAKLRFVVQWREPADPAFPNREDPVYGLTLHLLRQIDPVGAARANDEMEAVARSVSVPNIIFRTQTYLVFEQMLEYTVPAAGRYALVLESAQLNVSQLSGLKRELEIHPRIVIETVGTAAGAPRAVFRSYTSFTAGVGTPGDALGATTVGTGAPTAQSGGGTGLALRGKPDVLGPGALALGAETYSGEGVATAFAGGAAVLLLQARATAPNVFGSAGIEPGKKLELPTAWLQRAPRLERRKP